MPIPLGLAPEELKDQTEFNLQILIDIIVGVVVGLIVFGITYHVLS